MKLIDFIHADTDIKKQEINNILKSKDETYIEKRKNIRLVKTRTVLMILVFFFIITALNGFYGYLPKIELDFVKKLYTDEHTQLMTDLVLASKVSLIIAIALMMTKPLIAIVLMFINLCKLLIAVVMMMGKSLKKIIETLRRKDGNGLALEKTAEPSDKDTIITKQEREYMKQLMKEQLQFGLSKYGLLIVEDAPKKGIEIQEVIKGPTITRYWVNPNDILVKEINSKLDDIALAMSVQSVSMTQERGKLFLEVPNLPEARETVYFKKVYDEFLLKAKHPLEIPIGVTASGEVLTVALNKCPHLLIAGATGSGKSVCLNEILGSIILNASPKEVRLILADPKRVELSSYEGLPHLMRPIAKEIKDIIKGLKFGVNEMERRYKLFAEAKVKNIEAYHAKGNVLPYLVIVIDEVASAMVQEGPRVEEYVMRLAGEARAAGIHLILATQRPSVDVITGVIKANLPSAIAFATKSNTDSRVILDQPGAEKLLGEGDGLLMLPDRANLIRFQGAYLRDEEIELIIETAKKEYGSPTKMSPWDKEEDQIDDEEGLDAAEVKENEHKGVNLDKSSENEESNFKAEDFQSEQESILKNAEENFDAQLLSFICKEKIKGESILPGTTELTSLLERRKSDILESINHLIEKGHLERSGAGRSTKTKILIERRDAVHYLFKSDPKGYEEVYANLDQESE